MDYYNERDPYAPPMKKSKRDPAGPEDTEVTLKEQVFIPTDKYPGYNFIGSIIGPSGSILKALQKDCDAKISVLGKGSIKDKKKEEELIISDDAEHQHLKEALHVAIEVKGPRAEAHWRMANALTEVYKFMTPPKESPPMGGAGGGYDTYGGFDGTYEGYGAPTQGGGAMHGGRGSGPRGGAQRGGGQRGAAGGQAWGGRGGNNRGRGGGGAGAPNNYQWFQ